MENTRRELRGRKLTKGLKTPQQASIIIYLFKTSLEGSPNGTLFSSMTHIIFSRLSSLSFPLDHYPLRVLILLLRSTSALRFRKSFFPRFLADHRFIIISVKW